MKEELKEKIIKILERVDELHFDGFALKEYLGKLADQIIDLTLQSFIEAEINYWESKKECCEFCKCSGMKKEDTMGVYHIACTNHEGDCEDKDCVCHQSLNDQIPHLKQLLKR